jgi:hypothetical protein
LEVDSPPTPMDESTASFGVLILENVQPEDGATYRCTATNSVGQSLPYDVRVDVVEPLKIQLRPESDNKNFIRINHGQTAQIDCSFQLDQKHPNNNNGLSAGHSSNVRPVIKWLKNGLAISTSSTTANVNSKYQHSAVMMSKPSGQQEQIWSLSISNFQRADQGVYQCFAYTERESTQSSIRLLLGGIIFIM